jgi:hypothetical protein
MSCTDFPWTLKLVRRHLRICIQRAVGVPIAAEKWEIYMKLFASAALALAMLASPALVAESAVAQTKMDCSRLYKDFWEKIDRQKYARISAEQLAGVSRLALRAYDACQAGDELDAKALFDRLGKMQF